MMKRVLLAAPASLALVAAAPLAAQESEDEIVEIAEEGEASDGSDDLGAALGMFGEMFKVEPLTPEQEARLPLAQQIAAKVVPDGAMADMMQSMMGDFLGPLMEMGPSAAQETVAQGLGVSNAELDMEEAQLAEVAKLLDPAYEERREAQKSAFPNLMAEVASALEPGMRKAMSEIYAINFDAAELTALDGFFETEVGAKFARESYKMATDPRVLGASFEAMPLVMGKIGDIETAMEEATADLPAAREFADLSAAEKARVAELSGISVEDIEAQLNAAMEAEVTTFETEAVN